MSQTRSPIIEAVRDMVKGLDRASVRDQVTLREFDPLLLPVVEPLQPAEIKRIRESTHVSQAASTRLLNTSPFDCSKVADRAEEARSNFAQAAAPGPEAWPRGHRVTAIPKQHSIWPQVRGPAFGNGIQPIDVLPLV